MTTCEECILAGYQCRRSSERSTRMQSENRSGYFATSLLKVASVARASESALREFAPESPE